MKATLPRSSAEAIVIAAQYDALAALAAQRGIAFTKRELDILSFTVSGRTAKKIAVQLSISPRTVESHMRNIMQKMNCNSREAIIDFVENSGLFLAFNAHYTYLCTQAAFQKALQDIRQCRKDSGPRCSFISTAAERANASWIGELKSNLELAGIQVAWEGKEKLQARKPGQKNLYTHRFYICAKSSSKTDLQRLEKILSNEQNSSNELSFLVEGSLSETLLQQTIGKRTFFEIPELGISYFHTFKLLQHLLPDADVKPIIDEFQDYYDSIIKCQKIEGLSLENHKASISPKASSWLSLFFKLPVKRKLILSTTVVSMFFIFFASFSYLYNREHREVAQKSTPVRFDLPIPAESTMLERKELLNHLKSHLENTSGIYKVAIVGIGGSGKTTLARQYARTQKPSIIWEVHAASKGTIQNSFESLAGVLTQNDEDRRLLKDILSTSDPKFRVQRLISFVQDRLRLQPNWMLLFDNVEAFRDITNYFPHDPEVWGNGKVILTTKDRNIGNNSYIDHVVKVGELNEDEKYNLFTSIFRGDDRETEAGLDEKKIREFLEYIPPFPLDVSIAAYYLRATHISFETYLEHLQNYDHEFAKTQERILKEASNYQRTRYSIVTLSLKELMDQHKDFGDLLLMISLVDSIDIPRTLLEAYKKPVIVEDFIYQLSRYSHFLNEGVSHAKPALSIHQSTQNISLIYLRHLLGLTPASEKLKEISASLEGYITDIIENEDFEAMKLMIPHCETFLKREELIKGNLRASMSGNLGCIYYYLSNSESAKELLEASLAEFDSTGTKSPTYAHTLMYLGNVYRKNGDFEKAKELLQKSRLIYQDYPENDLGFARALGYLGVVYRELGEYETAKDLFEQALNIYEARYQNRIGHAWLLVQLGKVYMILGNYDKAEALFSQSADIYRQHSEDYVGVSWVLVYLGEVYRMMDKDDIAESLLNESLDICQKYFLDNHVYHASRLATLGAIYAQRGKCEEAIQLLNDSINIYNASYGPDNVKAGSVYRRLGKVYQKEGKMDLAEEHLLKSLKIFREKKSYLVFFALESLGEFYIRKAQNAADQHDQELEVAYKKKAEQYLEEALDFAKVRFTDLSPHYARVGNTLKKIS